MIDKTPKGYYKPLASNSTHVDDFKLVNKIDIVGTTGEEKIDHRRLEN